MSPPADGLRSSAAARGAALTGALLALSGVPAGCFGGGDDASRKPAERVGVVLPAGPRWAAVDRPLLQRAFRADGVPVTFAVARGGSAERQAQARRLLDGGARVLVVANTDSSSGASAEALGHAREAPVVAYDRLTLRGWADYYVSFDFIRAGERMGQGLVECLRDADVDKPRIAELNGPPDDEVASRLKQGYDSVLNPRFTQERAVKVADLSVPDRSARTAKRTAARILDLAHNRLDGVVAADDALAGALVAEARARGLPDLRVVGQGATPAGVRAVRAGQQCMTVRLPATKEVAAVAAVAGALARGEEPSGDLVDRVSDDTVRRVPSVLVEPKSVTSGDR